MQALQETGRDRRNIAPDAFDWQANSQGQRSRIARLRSETAHKLLGKASDRAVELALPAYESLGPTNGTDGDQETFSVSHGIRDCPNTQNVVVWLDGDYYGTPDNDDAVDTGDITVTDPGSTRRCTSSTSRTRRAPWRSRRPSTAPPRPART